MASGTRLFFKKYSRNTCTCPYLLSKRGFPNEYVPMTWNFLISISALVPGWNLLGLFIPPDFFVPI